MVAAFASFGKGWQEKVHSRSIFLRSAGGSKREAAVSGAEDELRVLWLLRRSICCWTWCAVATACDEDQRRDDLVRVETRVKEVPSAANFGQRLHHLEIAR